MQEGTVKWFDPAKGYGFVIPSDGSTDVYFNRTKVDPDGKLVLAPGTKVRFEVLSGPKGRPAVTSLSVVEVPVVVPLRKAPAKPPPRSLSWEEEFIKEWALKPVG